MTVEDIPGSELTVEEGRELLREEAEEHFGTRNLAEANRRFDVLDEWRTNNED